MYEIDLATVEAVLRGGRAGLITDVDGTIAPIVLRPADARVLPRAREALAGLRDLLRLVAVVSGRRAADARELVNVGGLVYVGNHGLEIGDDVLPEARPWVSRLARVMDQIANQLTDPEGIVLENKGVTASLHYRLAPDRATARQRLLGVVARTALTSGLRVEEGRMVINLLPPLTVTKGSAVAWLAREYGLERMVYFGDDVTDAHAFRALRTLRETHAIQTLAIGVVGPETPQSVRQLADASVPTVEAVADIMCHVLERLSTGDSMLGRASPVPNGRETDGQ